MNTIPILCCLWTSMPTITQQAIEQTIELTPIQTRISTIARPAWLFMLGGHSADAVSTIYALNQGAIEANPLYGKTPNTGRILVTKAAGASVQMLLMKLLERKGHNKIAEIIGYGTGISLGTISIHNVIQGKRLNQYN